MEEEEPASQLWLPDGMHQHLWTRRRDGSACSECGEVRYGVFVEPALEGVPAVPGEELEGHAYQEATDTLYARLNIRIANLNRILTDNIDDFPCDLDGTLAMAANVCALAKQSGISWEDLVNLLETFYHDTKKAEEVAG